MATKVGFWLALKTWMKPNHNRVVVCIKRDNDSLFAVMTKKIVSEVYTESYQITDFHLQPPSHQQDESRIVYD